VVDLPLQFSLPLDCIPLIEDVICGFSERRVDETLLRKIKKQGEVVSNYQAAKRADRATWQCSPSAHETMSEMYNLIFAKLIAIYATGHPEADRALTILPRIAKPENQKSAFTCLYAKQQFVLARELGDNLYPKHKREDSFVNTFVGTCLQSNDFEGARMCLEEQRLFTPDNPYIHAQAMYAYNMLDRHQETLDLSDRTLALIARFARNEVPVLTTTYGVIGKAEECVGSKEKAKDFYRKALALDPKLAPQAKNLILLLLEEHRSTANPSPSLLEEAARLAEDLVANYPDNEGSHALLTKCCLAKGEHQKAIEEGEIALAIARGKPLPQIEPASISLPLAAAYDNMGNQAAAAKHLANALNYQCSPLTLAAFVDHLISLRDFKSAIAYLKTGIAIFPEKADLYTASIAFCLRELDQLDAALETYRELHREHPDNPDLAFHLGVCYFRKERFAEAIDCFRQVSERSRYFW
jgi:tetratricopeptide (TPR) repeat protein